MVETLLNECVFHYAGLGEGKDGFGIVEGAASAVYAVT
jgi:hypothetical protein